MIAPGLSTWIVDALIASTLLMTAVLLARGWVRRAFGSRTAYALWSLPVLRMVLPPLPDAWLTPWGQAAPIARVGERVAVLIIRAPADVAIDAATPHPGLGAAVTVAWLSGAAAFFLWHVASYWRMRRRLLAGAVPIERCGRVRVVASDAAQGPLAFGVLRRFVAFPRDLAERYDPSERALALAHELGHHARGDLLANWAALAVLALHWCNPIAWRAYRAFRADQEIANDARVLAGRSPAERHAYACAILKSAHGGPVAAACHLHTITDLKGRLLMLTTCRQSRARLLGGSTAVAAILLAGLGLTASGSRASEVAAASVGEALRAALPAAQQVPQPPAPPRSGGDSQAPTPPAPVATPGAPGAPQALAAPDAPQAPAAPLLSVGPAGARVVATGQPGKLGVFTDDGRDLAPGATQRACSADEGKPGQLIVVSGTTAKALVVCTNRIDRLVADSTAAATSGIDAAAIERNAVSSALDSLRDVRAYMQGNVDLPAAERAEGVAEMNAAIKELEYELAHPDADD